MILKKEASSLNNRIKLQNYIEAKNVILAQLGCNGLLVQQSRFSPISLAKVRILHFKEGRGFIPSANKREEKSRKASKHYCWPRHSCEVLVASQVPRNSIAEVAI